MRSLALTIIVTQWAAEVEGALRGPLTRSSVSQMNHLRRMVILSFVCF